ncbi:unnamed protein product, partial [Prorocentrum cordatum]
RYGIQSEECGILETFGHAEDDPRSRWNVFAEAARAFRGSMSAADMLLATQLHQGAYLAAPQRSMVGISELNAQAPWKQEICELIRQASRTSSWRGSSYLRKVSRNNIISLIALFLPPRDGDIFRMTKRMIERTCEHITLKQDLTEEMVVAHAWYTMSRALYDPEAHQCYEERMTRVSASMLDFTTSSRGVASFYFRNWSFAVDEERGKPSQNARRLQHCMDRAFVTLVSEFLGVRDLVMGRMSQLTSASQAFLAAHRPHMASRGYAAAAEAARRFLDVLAVPDHAPGLRDLVGLAVIVRESGRSHASSAGHCLLLAGELERSTSDTQRRAETMLAVSCSWNAWHLRALSAGRR